jgi:hypothetical protein
VTAPSAPRILVRQNGTRIYVRWQPVLNATDYKLYVDEVSPPLGLEDDILASELGSDGWFFDISGPQAGPTYVAVTALNIIAEESVKSNIVQVNLMGDGATNHPTDALHHVRKGARY